MMTAATTSASSVERENACKAQTADRFASALPMCVSLNIGICSVRRVAVLQGEEKFAAPVAHICTGI
jgi:hypothetical protein